MSIIDRIELYFVRMPLPAPIRLAWIPGYEGEATQHYIIRLVTDDGVEGWSAMSAGTLERAGMGDSYCNMLMGIDATDIDLVTERIKVMASTGNNEMWIEPAFWDIKGKLAGKPVYELLGGKAEPVELYASSGDVKEPEARIEEAWARYEEGFRTFKIRVHDFDEAVDIRQIQETARALEGKMKIAVDCNQAFRLTHVGPGPKWDLARAKRFADACAEVGAAWIEEPLYMDCFEDMVELNHYSTKVPISGGELHTRGLAEMKYMIEKDCYAIYQPDAMWAGGIAENIEVAKLCRKHGVGFNPHTWSNGLGFGVNLQILLGTDFVNEQPFEYPYSPPGWTIEARDSVLAEPWGHDNGVLTPPETPGLGFEIDPDKLAKYGKCFFKADRVTRHWMPEVLMG